MRNRQAEGDLDRGMRAQREPSRPRPSQHCAAKQRHSGLKFLKHGGKFRCVLYETRVIGGTLEASSCNKSCLLGCIVVCSVTTVSFRCCAGPPRCHPSYPISPSRSAHRHVCVCVCKGGHEESERNTANASTARTVTSAQSRALHGGCELQ